MPAPYKIPRLRTISRKSRVKDRGDFFRGKAAVTFCTAASTSQRVNSLTSIIISKPNKTHNEEKTTKTIFFVDKIYFSQITIFDLSKLSHKLPDNCHKSITELIIDLMSARDGLS